MPTRPITFLAVLAFAPVTSVIAQEQLPRIEPGTRVRVEHQGGRHVGTLVDFGADSVMLIGDADGDRIALPLVSVVRMDVRRRSMWTHGATIGAAVGSVAAGLTGYAAGHGSPDRRGTFTVLGVAGGAVAGAALARGPRARRSALLALAVGTALGAPLFGPVCEENQDFTCSVLMGLAFGGIPAFVLGSGIGLLLRDDDWKEVPLNGLRVSVLPQSDGRFGLGLSVGF